MDKIDFRSDTVTWPTQAMRRAMAEAPVGDDVYGEDPTVNRLEAVTAARLGKEAGLFVASGTMGNLTAVLTHADRGDEAIVGNDAHIYCWEAGGMAALGGVIPHPLPTQPSGEMDLNRVETAVRGDDPHWPRSRLILLENSYGARNGAPIAPPYFATVADLARSQGLAVHLDGARFYNAVTALGVEAAAITQHVDSVSICLSKGLCAPAGSVLCGSADFIHQARRVRKLLGGGMRQAGVLAAAGLLAVEEMSGRLADDHACARRLAAGLAALPGIVVSEPPVRTNIVFFSLTPDAAVDAATFIDAMRERANIWLSDDGAGQLRAVTHYWVGREDVELLLATAADVLRTAV